MKLTESNLKRLILEVLEEQYGWEHSADAARERMWELKPLVKAGQKEYEEEYRAAMWRSWQPDSTMSPEEIAKQQARDDAAEEERERRQQAREDAEFKDMMATRAGYKDRGIDMGPDDPGDVDDIYPQKLEETEDDIINRITNFAKGKKDTGIKPATPNQVSSATNSTATGRPFRPWLRPGGSAHRGNKK